MNLIWRSEAAIRPGVLGYDEISGWLAAPGSVYAITAVPVVRALVAFINDALILMRLRRRIPHGVRQSVRAASMLPAPVRVSLLADCILP